MTVVPFSRRALERELSAVHRHVARRAGIDDRCENSSHSARSATGRPRSSRSDGCIRYASAWASSLARESPSWIARMRDPAEIEAALVLERLQKSDEPRSV